MDRIRFALAVATGAACLAACSSPITPAIPMLTAAKPETSVAATTAKPPPFTPPPFTPPASPVKITAACPFLGTAELQELLGTSEDLIALEQPPDETYAPGTEFQCRYEGKYVHPGLLDLWIISSANSYPPAKAMANSEKDCGGPMTAVPGAGEGAYFCDLTGSDVTEMIITGKRAHGQNRLAIAYVVKHRKEVYARLAVLLGERL
ncbi:hypothetical protein PV458_43180 [Streptomyces sp. MN03-5084-2B]|nr:hypothetical protein [Streptomyces sp. MN03-5084-2B]